MFRFIKNILVLVVFLCLPVMAVMYSADPDERAHYIAWIKRVIPLPGSEPVAAIKKEISEIDPEKLLVRFNESAEGFQQIANCGKTETLAVEEASSSNIYRWVDKEGQVHFGDKEPGKLVSSEQVSINYANRKRYFNLKIIEDTVSLPAFTRDKVSADVRQIYGILSRDMDLDHLRQVQLNVRIIETQDAFQTYKAQVAPQISTNSGFYTSKNNEAVVFQGEHEPSMLAVIRHEATHVIVAGLYGYSPVWFNEGIAEYFEHMQIRGQLRKIAPVSYHLIHLRKLALAGALPSLQNYMNYNPDQWYSGNLRDNYAMAWSLMYFLMSDQTGKKLLQDMMNQLAQNYCWQFSSVSYFEESYPGGLVAMETNWREWLNQEPSSHRY